MAGVFVQRAFTAAPGGAPARDPKGVGKGVGPEAGPGYQVHARVQVVHPYGNQVSVAMGAYLGSGAKHAEVQALDQLRPHLEPSLEGGRLMCAVDQVPCADCASALRTFAWERGLTLEVYLPERASLRDPTKMVKPKQAARGAMRADRPPIKVRLSEYVPWKGPTIRGGTVLGVAGGRSGGGPSAMTRGAALTALERQTAKTRAFGHRVQTYVRLLGSLFDAFDLFSAATDALSMAANGTVLREAQSLADRLVEQARQAKSSAEDLWADFSVLIVIAEIDDLTGRKDATALAALGDALYRYNQEVGNRAREVRLVAEDTAKRAQAALVLADFYLRLAYVPGPSTAGAASALAMHESLVRYSGTLRTAATNYRDAAQLLIHLSWYAGELSAIANRAAFFPQGG